MRRRVKAAILVAGAAGALAAATGRRRRAWGGTGRIVVSDLHDDTAMDETGAVRSAQAATVTVSAAELAALWEPAMLERLARTYWRFLSRVTLGAVRVAYTDHARSVVLLARPLRLLRFRPPEYTLGERHASVRWRIEDGLLVARAGRGKGYLQIDVRRKGPDPVRPGDESLRVQVEVASFHPSIASGISRRFYEHTQSAIHVVVTHAFLRSLSRLDLARSRVGRLS